MLAHCSARSCTHPLKFPCSLARKRRSSNTRALRPQKQFDRMGQLSTLLCGSAWDLRPSEACTDARFPCSISPRCEPCKRRETVSHTRLKLSKHGVSTEMHRGGAAALRCVDNSASEGTGRQDVSDKRGSATWRGETLGEAAPAPRARVTIGAAAGMSSSPVGGRDVM